jgi:hypothetical protein
MREVFCLMTPNPRSESNDVQLNSLLREWVVDAPPPPRFQELVWQRIARTEARATRGFWVGLSQWLEVALPRPKIAFAYLTALLVLGMTAGSVAAQLKSSHLNAALSARYVQSIDPYREAVPQP